jgi:adenylate kinase family enzyme
MQSSDESDWPWHRVLVIGCPGAGKTAFARKLAKSTGLPLIHLDFHHWRPGWQLPDLKVWRQQVVALAAAPAWIMDGNYSNTYDVRMPRADTVIWLDYSHRICMRRVLLRVLTDMAVRGRICRKDARSGSTSRSSVTSGNFPSSIIRAS